MASGGKIVNNGMAIIVDRLANDAPTREEPTKWRVGTGTTTVAISDTGMESQVAIVGTEAVDDCEATTGWTASGTNSVSLNSTTFKENANSLNMVKSDTGSATMTISKTTTSVDFTSKTFFMWFYIHDDIDGNLATTDCLSIRFGSDASNYYLYTRDAADLVAGWNLIQFTSTSADSTVGTPTITACDYTYVETVFGAAANTATAGQMMVDEFKVASSDDFHKAFDSGYPSVDTSLMQVTYKSTLLSTEAVGHNIAEYGIFNEDGTALMFLHNVFTARSKSVTDEFIFTVKLNFTQN